MLIAEQGLRVFVRSLLTVESPSSCVKLCTVLDSSRTPMAEEQKTLGSATPSDDLHNVHPQMLCLTGVRAVVDGELEAQGDDSVHQQG